MKKILSIIATLSVTAALYGGMSYTINHTRGIVTDNNTGLVWLRCPLSSPGAINTNPDCLGHTDNDTFLWDDAINACNQLKTQKYQGYSNWRLPNIRELQSIADYKYGMLPSINQTAFPNIVALKGVYHYWSSTPHKNNNNFAWFVDFYNGTIAFADKNDAKEENKKIFVRCVAGPGK